MGRIINTIIINTSIVILILFLIYTSYNMKNMMIQTSKIEISYSNLKDSIIKTDDVLLLKEKVLIMENDIKTVDELNNKRFEMFGWVFGILISTFAILLLVSYVNSKSTMRDMVYEELNDKNAEFTNQYNKLLSDLKIKKDEMTAEINRLKQ